MSKLLSEILAELNQQVSEWFKAGEYTSLQQNDFRGNIPEFITKSLDGDADAQAILDKCHLGARVSWVSNETTPTLGITFTPKEDSPIVTIGRAKRLGTCISLWKSSRARGNQKSFPTTAIKKFSPVYQYIGRDMTLAELAEYGNELVMKRLEARYVPVVELLLEAVSVLGKEKVQKLVTHVQPTLSELSSLNIYTMVKEHGSACSLETLQAILDVFSKKKKVYRFVLAFDGEPQGAGFLSGLEDIGLNEDMENGLLDLFSSLTIPRITNPAQFWFTEQGIETFAPAINRVIEEIEPYGWSLLGKVYEPTAEDMEAVIYQDEHQIAWLKKNWAYELGEQITTNDLAPGYFPVAKAEDLHSV